MAKDVKINGVDYAHVRRVSMPTTTGETALFLDADEYRTAVDQDSIDDGKVDKHAIASTGIDSEYFATLFNGPFTVTTAETEGYESPHALANVTGRIPKQFTYVVTVNSVRYDLPCDLDVEKEPTTIKCYEYIGNLSLKDPTAGSRITKPIRDVPFLIVSDLDNAGSIDIYTKESGEFTIEVLQRHRVGEKFPNFNLYGTDYSPFEIKNHAGTFNGLSLGVNNIKNARGSMLIGYGNTSNDEFGYAIGTGNEVDRAGCAIGDSNKVTGVEGVAVGYNNNVTAQCAFAEGRQNASSGSSSHAEGYKNTASGDMSHSEGRQNVSSGRAAHAEGYNNNASGNMSHAEGLQTNATAQGAHTEGGGTNADGQYSHAEGRGTTASHRAQHVFGEFNATDTSTEIASSRGNYVEIVGNGSDADHRTNARTLDWDGNETLAGSLTINGNKPVATEEYVNDGLSEKQDIITASGGLSKSDNTISADPSKIPVMERDSWYAGLVPYCTGVDNSVPTWNAAFVSNDAVAWSIAQRNSSGGIAGIQNTLYKHVGYFFDEEYSNMYRYSVLSTRPTAFMLNEWKTNPNVFFGVGDYSDPEETDDKLIVYVYYSEDSDYWSFRDVRGVIYETQSVSLFDSVSQIY